MQASRKGHAYRWGEEGNGETERVSEAGAWVPAGTGRREEEGGSKAGA